MIVKIPLYLNLDGLEYKRVPNTVLLSLQERVRDHLNVCFRQLTVRDEENFSSTEKFMLKTIQVDVERLLKEAGVIKDTLLSRPRFLDEEEAFDFLKQNIG